MIGNDVVDLREPGTAPGARHLRFDARVFTPDERDAIDASDSPERLRWVLWAAKEAAYKVAKKLEPATVFAPGRFHVSLDASLRGAVCVGSWRLPVRVEVFPEAVHAVATSEGVRPSHIHSELTPLPDGVDAGVRVRERALRAVAPVLHVEREALAVGRSDRVPVLLYRGQPARADLSLSHHGSLVAWACEIRASRSPV